MSFETTASDFAAALADPSAATPAMTRGRTGAPDARRFAVYRNNVAVGLIGALEARYPVSRRIAGDELFRAMARAFVRAHKPRSPVMIAYGGDFPEFAADYLAGCGWAGGRVFPTWRGSRMLGSNPIILKTQPWRQLSNWPRSTPIVCPIRGSPFIPRRNSCVSRRQPRPYGPHLSPRMSATHPNQGAPKTRSSRVPIAMFACVSSRRSATTSP